MSMDASLERFSAAKNKFSPTSLKYYPESSELDLPEKLAFLIHYDRMFTLLSGSYGQTQRLKEQLTVELQAFHVVINIDANDLDVDNLPYTLLARYMAESSQRDAHQDSYQGSFSASIQESFQDSRQSKEQAIVELKLFSDSLTQRCRKAILIVSGRKMIDAKTLSELMVLSEKVGISLVLFSEKSLADKRFLKPFVDQIYSVHLGSLSVFDLKRYIRRTRTDDTALSSRQLETLAKESAEDPARVDDLVEGILSEPKRPIGLSLIHLSMVATLLILLASVFFVNESFQLSETENISIALKNPTANQLNSASVKEADSFSAVQDTQPNEEITAEPFLIEKLVENLIDNPLDNSLGANTDSFVQVGLNIESVPMLDKQPTRVIVGGTTSVEGARELRVIEPTKLPSSATALPRTVSVPGQSYSTGFVAENYTLQLVGSGSEDAIKGLIAQQRGDIELEYFKTRRGAQDWFILTAGNFGSREAALLAVSRLPLNLKNMKPWARTIASIQDVSN